MILSKVEIENYKQYAGHHEVEIPEVATIGVIGSNGVGKTTLFEAIEWALYNPSTIKSAEIRPRGRSGYTKVTLTLEDPNRNRRYIVERELKRASVTAAIYEIEQGGDEKLIVQGTKPVSDYVATSLIGLSHRAFVATFFTRQKELSFFGSLGDSDRRREVSRLLGMETIRIAQQSIAEDRKRLAADALSYRRQYEEQSSGRDFSTEMTAARETIAASNAALVEAGTRVQAFAEQVTVFEWELHALEAVRDRDVALGQELTVAQGQHAAAVQRREQIDIERERLARREIERGELLPRAERLAQLESEIESLERERQRFVRQRELNQSLREANQRRDLQVRQFASTVHSIELTEPIAGWTWSHEDAADPVTGARRLREITIAVDLAGAVTQEQHLTRALNAAKAMTEADVTLAKYQAAQEQLKNDLGSLMEAGDPAEILKDLEKRRDEYRGVISTIRAQQAQRDGQEKQARALIENLDHQHFGDHCPTCARPFNEHDAALVLQSLRTQIETIGIASREDKVKAQQLQRELDSLDPLRDAQNARAKRIADLRGRIGSSVTYVEDQLDLVEKSARELEQSLANAGLVRAPSQDDLSRARDRVSLYRRIADCRRPFTDGEEALVQLADQVGQLSKELASLADVAFDEARYKEVATERQVADRARSAIEQIDRELARRDELERERKTTIEREVVLTTTIASLTEQRQINGFSSERLTAIQQDLRTSRLNEREATEGRHAAQIVVRDAHQALETLEKDQARVADLAISADERQREADIADRMYREFTEFDKYAAAHYTPILGDLTSDLVREVTDGKYDRVEFDSNYGIEVFDGTEEHFPLTTFSGGERDAIALCARLALSRMIGSQASSPPGFLVLDEVFGSLDRDRRGRLLDMLGKLASGGNGFQQMFIISHVDDVRTAPMFDELWRIEESIEGESQIVNLAAGTEIDDL